MRRMDRWLPPLDLACAAGAGAIWCARPQWGPWALALVLAPWVLRWALTGRPSRRTPLDVPLTVFLATAGIGVWAAYDRETAWAKFWVIVGAIALYYALANQPTTRHLRVFATLYALFGAGIAGYFLWTNNWIHGKAKIDALTRWGEAIQAALPYLPGHRMHPNVVGGMLAIIVPFQIALLARGKRGVLPPSRWSGLNARRWLAGSALAITAFGLLLTTSRGGWLALSASLSVWGLWRASGISDPKLSMPHRSPGRITRFMTLLAAAVVVVGIGLLVVPGGPQRLLAVVPGQNQMPDRVSLWYRATCLLQDTPFTGGGLGSFPALDSAYAYPITRWSRYRTDIWVTNSHSHNLWLDVGVEQGLLGLAALLWIQGTFGVVVWQGRRTADQQSGLLVEAAVVSALVVLGHGLVDDTLYASRGVLLLLVPMGVVVAQSQRRPGVFEIPDLMVAVPVGLIALSLAALVWRQPLVAAWQADLGAVAQARVELAGYLDEDWNLYRVQAAADLGRSINHFERALALDPDQPTANLRLGLIWLRRGEYEAAIPLLEHAYQLRPRLQAARQALGEAYLAVGRLEEAVVLWAGVDEAGTKLQQISSGYRSRGDEVRAADAAWVAERVGSEN